MNKNHENGALSVILILLVVAAIGLLTYLFISSRAQPQTMMEETTFVTTQEESAPTETADEEFAPVEEDETTPEEINNQALDELDQLILSVEGTEDLSDLGDY